MPGPGEVLVGHRAVVPRWVEHERVIDIPGLLYSVWQMASAEWAALLLWKAFELMWAQKMALQLGGYPIDFALVGIYRAGSNPESVIAVPINDPVGLAELEQLAQLDRLENGADLAWRLTGVRAFDSGNIDKNVKTYRDPTFGMFGFAKEKRELFDAEMPMLDFCSSGKFIAKRSGDDWFPETFEWTGRSQSALGLSMTPQQHETFLKIRAFTQVTRPLCVPT